MSFADLALAFNHAPAAFRTVDQLVAHSKMGRRALDALFRVHAHVTPEQWLRSTRATRAAEQLLQTRDRSSDVVDFAGYPDASTFTNEFRAVMRMPPVAYRGLDPVRGFVLELPSGYRADEVLAYQARDPESITERSSGRTIQKALMIDGKPVVVELEIGDGNALVRVRQRTTARAEAHRAALSILGLRGEVDAFEKKHRVLVKPRRGLRVPLIPSGFDALCWAIIGQQINLKFATTLRRRMIAAAGESIDGMRAHPTPAAIASLESSTLTSQQFSRSKARYLRDTAEAITSGKLPIETLWRGSAVTAEESLVAQRGVGIWTARYVLMRSGFADAAPVGDSGLASALQRLHKLPSRPAAKEMERLMERFAPNRSLASMHLWSSLADATATSPAP